MTTNTHGQQLLDAIITDHHEVEAVFVELESDSGDPTMRREMVDHVIAELVRHSIGEEQFVYPAIRRTLGDEIADHEIAEHAEVEQSMKQLDGLDPGDEKFSALLR